MSILKLLTLFVIVGMTRVTPLATSFRSMFCVFYHAMMLLFGIFDKIFKLFNLQETSDFLFFQFPHAKIPIQIFIYELIFKIFPTQI